MAFSIRVARVLEVSKNWLVQTLLWKRGALRKPIVHFGMASLVSAVLVLSGATFGSQGLIATTYPGIPSDLSFPENTWDQVISQSESLGLGVSLETIESEKPRDRIINYEVQPGDTVSSIAADSGIDAATIQWANPNLSDIDDLMPGDTLQVLPVSGIGHQVKAGETIYSIAEKYGLKDEDTGQINAQPILNWPFNDIGEDLAIKVDQVLIVPGGFKKEEKPWVPPTGPVSAQLPIIAHQGVFGWPFAGGCAISQWPAWYHMAADCTNPVGTPVGVAGNGVVTAVTALSWGYGYHIIVDHGNGLQTLYGHLSGFNVNVGDRVGQGQTIGWVGLTGRTTGAHLHFEVRKNGAPVNPLNYLP